MRTRAAVPTTIAVTAMTGLAMLASSCSLAVYDASATLPGEANSAAFLDRISSLQEVSENDALRGMLMLVDGQDTKANFGQRVEAMQTKNILPRGAWDHVDDRPLTRGRLAYMVYQAAGIEGGLTLRLTGPTQRYCLRELQYRGFISDGSWYAPVSGIEYVAVLSRAATYMETGELPETMRVTWRQ